MPNGKLHVLHSISLMLMERSFLSSQSANEGAVIRDNEGRVTATLNKHLPLPLGPLEAKAMEEGVIFAWDVGIQEVIVKCDSQIVVDALNGVGEPPTAISNIIEGICHKFQEFRQVQIFHVRRQGNRSAYFLTQDAKHVVSYIIWIEENPRMLESNLAQGVLFLSSS